MYWIMDSNIIDLSLNLQKHINDVSIANITHVYVNGNKII
jgi:hypothetical protein